MSLEDILVTVGWGVSSASITLQALYVRSFVSLWDLALLLVVSVLAGMILVDVEIIVISYVGSFLLSLLMMFFCLTLPATLGRIQFAELGQTVAVIMIFRSVFPIPVILCPICGLIGGVIGEKLWSS